MNVSAASGPEPLRLLSPRSPARPRLPLLWVTWRQHGAALAFVALTLGVAVGGLLISAPKLSGLSAVIGRGSFGKL
jgi:hypothetical protein